MSSRRARRTALWGVTAAVFLVGTGVGSVLPILWDRRCLGAGSTVSTAIIAPIYPLLHSIPAVIGVGVIEASTAAFAEPAINAFLMSAVTRDQRGRAAGPVGTAETAAKAAGALVGGGLFGLGVWVPFVVSSVAGLAVILMGLPWLRTAGRDPDVRPALAVAGHG